MVENRETFFVRSDWSNRQTIDQITHAERFIGTLRLLRLSNRSVEFFSLEGKVQKQEKRIDKTEFAIHKVFPSTIL